jgi:hypothetical protein
MRIKHLSLRFSGGYAGLYVRHGTAEKFSMNRQACD